MRGIILDEIGATAFAACVLACCMAIADDERPDAKPPGEQGSAEAGSREPGPPSGGADEHTLSEIQQIRRRLGADPFRGTILEDVKPADLEAGKNLPADRADNRAESGFDTAIRAVAAGQASRNQRQNRLPEMGARYAAPVVTEVSSASVLRQAARTLEDEAADLDDVGLYPEADRLRLLADQFWQKARQLDRPPRSGGSLP